MRNYKYVVFNADRSITVKTPKPYTLAAELQKHETEYQIQDKMYGLQESCLFLYECMKVLGVDKKSAAARGYTLNILTGESLRRIAHNKEMSNVWTKMFANHRW